MWDGEPNNAGRFAIPFWRIHYDQDMRCSGIYRIDLGNGYFYIGSSVNLKRRKVVHKTDLRSLRHSNQKMQNCWNKYGIFEFVVLEECEKSDLLLREQQLIDKHFSDPKNVNLAPTAGSPLGVIHSADSCANMSAAAQNRSNEHRAKISAAQIGRFCSAQTKNKMSASHKGIPMSDKTRANMSAAAQNRSPEHCANLSVAAQKRWARVRMEKQIMEEMQRGKECW